MSLLCGMMTTGCTNASGAFHAFNIELALAVLGICDQILH